MLQKSLIPQKQPTGLRDGLNLYKYQLDAVAWMKSIEDDVNDEFDFKYCTLIPWRSAKTDILFDISARKFVTFDDISNHLSTFSPKGAVLADEVNALLFVLIVPRWVLERQSSVICTSCNV